MRHPRGYVGVEHEILGSDLLAVLGTVSTPEVTLGPGLAAGLRSVEAERWYPIGRMLEIGQALENSLGRNGLRQMGRELFRRTHTQTAKQHFHSARDLIFGMDTLYHNANRGREIGGWKVVEFRPGFARIEKTTPIHCMLEEGIVAEALMALGIPALVQQRECFRSGAEACIYEVSAPVFDARWLGEAKAASG